MCVCSESSKLSVNRHHLSTFTVKLYGNILRGGKLIFWCLLWCSHQLINDLMKPFTTPYPFPHIGQFGCIVQYYTILLALLYQLWCRPESGVVWCRAQIRPLLGIIRIVPTVNSTKKYFGWLKIWLASPFSHVYDVVMACPWSLLLGNELETFCPMWSSNCCGVSVV